MNLEFAERRLSQLTEALAGVGLPAHAVHLFSGDPGGISRDVELFRLKIPHTSTGQYGIRMDGLGIMTIVGIENGDDSSAIPIRRVTSISQVVDILYAFAQNELNYHLMGAAA